MKTLTTVLTIICLGLYAQGQEVNLELVLKEKSNEPTSKTEHYYLLQLKNNSDKSASITLQAHNISCSDIGNRTQTELVQTFLDKNKVSQLSNITARSQEVNEFFVKINRRKNTQLNTWNCTEIVAKSVTDNTISNSVVIKSFIPDPKDFH